MSNTSSYAIAKVGRRFKTSGQIAACDQHNSRSRETPNADINKSASNEHFVGGNEQPLCDLVRNRIGNNGGRKIRTSADPTQSAVLAFEMMLSASPEYFRPDNSSVAGEWDLEKLKAWEALSAQWLQERYGDNIVRATFHRDEATPHIHAVIVPLNAKGHINAKEYIGGRENLVALQDSYAEAMKPLGLSRGIRGSRMQHENIKEFYKSVKQIESLDLPIEELKALAVDRQRQVQKRDEFEQTALALSAENFQLKGQLAALQSQIGQLQKLADKSHELRAISLPEVALRLGMQPSEFDANRWYGKQHSIVIGGPQFRFAGEESKGYGAIDLVMHIKSVGFSESLVWLEQHLGTGTARAATVEQLDAAMMAIELNRFTAPVQSEARWPAVRARLLKQTRLPSQLIDQLYAAGMVYADAQSNAVFIERDAAGATAGAIRCDIQGAIERVVGSDEGAAFYVVVPDNQLMEKPDRIVVTDDPIETLSKLTLEKSDPSIQRTQYQALGGSRALLVQVEGMSRVDIALSCSDAGDRAAQEIYRVIPWATDERPEGSHQAQIKAQLERLQARLKPLAAAQPEQSQKTPHRAQQNAKKQRRERDRGLGL